MGLILCGWCAHPTRDRDACDHCRHRDPRKPYEQRGVPVPDATEDRKRRLREAEATVRASGREPTADRLAEILDVSPRTVRRWQQVTA